MSAEPPDAEMRALRRRAEIILERGVDPGDARAAVDGDLIHELHVAHQELSLQAHALRSTEFRLRAALARSEALFAHAPCGLLRVDDRGAVTRANQRAVALLGDIEGQPLLGALHPEDRQSTQRLLARVTAEHESSTTARFVSPASPVMCHIRAVRLDHEADRSTLVLVEPMDAYVELATRGTLLEAAVKQSSQGIMLTAPDGDRSTIVYVNAAMCLMSGREPDELLGRQPGVLYGPGQGADAGWGRIEQALRAQQPFKGRSNQTRPDGEMYVAEVSVNPVFDPGGRLQSFVWTVSDVTREVREAQHREHAQRLEAVGTLAGGVAHDFNNMLTVIHTLAELGRLDAGDDEMVSLFDDILDTAQRASALTRRLLAFAGHDDAPPQRLDLREALDGIAAVARRLVPESIAIELRHADEPVALMVNPTHLEQIVLNLVTNARDAIGDRSGHIVLVTRPSDGSDAEPPLAPGRYVALDAIDDGAGIPSALRSRIFAPFVTSKPDHQGTGLGLAVVSDITRRYGGGTAVGPADAPTRVSIFLPVDADPPTASVAPPPAESSSRSALDVMIVEDDPRVRDAVHRALAARGHRVRAFADAHAGLSSLEAHRPDVLVTDVVMPSMSGVALADRARRLAPDLGIVFVSGYVGGEMRDRPLHPRERFLSKPFSTEALLETIGALGA